MSCEIDCPRVFDSTRRATTTVAETLGQEPNRIGRDPVISCTWLVSHQNTFFDQASFHQLAALDVRYGQTVLVNAYDCVVIGLLLVYSHFTDRSWPTSRSEASLCRISYDHRHLSSTTEWQFVA